MSMVLRVDDQGLVDLEWDGGLVDNEAGPDIITAVVISLFSDRRAPADVGLPLHERRGYAADPSLGSRVWLAFREPLSQEALTRMRNSAEESLAWIIADGVASEVTVTVERVDRVSVKLAVEVRRGEAEVWAHAWRVTQDEVADAL